MPLVLVIVLALLAYANALRNGFVLDDVSIIVENPLIRSLDIARIFHTHYWDRAGVAVAADPGLYRPLTILSYAVDYSLWGLNATASHAVNIGLNALATAAVFLVAFDVLRHRIAAFAAAAIFAVHPLHTEAVVGIVGRAEVLATLFFVASFWILRRPASFGVDSSPGRTVVHITLGALLYLLGLFSKETAVTLPAVLALDDWLRRDELQLADSSMRRMLVARYVALALAAAIYFVFRQQAVTSSAHIWPGFLGVSAGARILTASRVAMEYVGLFVFPWRLSADYWTTDVAIATSPFSLRVLVSLLLWIGAALVVVRGGRRHAAIVLGIGWFFITLSPVSNVVFPIGVAKAERLLYLPSVGLCLLAGGAYRLVEDAVRGPNIPRFALALTLALFTARTVVRNRDWKDNLTLALATLEVSPSSPLMNDMAAGELVKQGQANRALPLLREAVRQAPDMPLIRSHLGATLYSMGQLDQAIAEYQEAIRRNAADVDAHNNLGVAYLDKKREAEAIAEFNTALRLKPNFADPHLNLGGLYFEQRRFDDAVREYTAAVRVSPASAPAHNALGVAFVQRGQFDSAEVHYREALRLQPDFAQARDNLARLGQNRRDQPLRPKE